MKLTIGMACYDDFDGVWFTIKSLLLYHLDVRSQCELLVVDNHANSAHGREVEKFLRKISPARYVAYSGPGGTAQSRNEVFRQARTPFVLCLDCHVLLEPGSLASLLAYVQEHPGSNDLLQGPLVGDGDDVIATHQEQRWRGQAYGVWGIDQRGMSPASPPFEIAQQGMGCFAMRKASWPGFHEGFRGFGGCESYVAQQVRNRGGRVVCLPFLRWHHRFPRPNGVPYRALLEDRLHNYWLTARSLGWDMEEMFAGFTEGLEDAQVVRLRRWLQQFEACGKHADVPID